MARPKTSEKRSIVDRLGLQRSYTSLILGIFVVVIAAILIVALVRRGGGGMIPNITSPSDAPQVTAPQEQQITLPTTYTTVEGDTLWSIAEKHYKSGYNWVDVAEANKLDNPSALTIGMSLTIPSVEAKASTIGEMVMDRGPNAIEGDMYTVAKDDNLWNIAVRAYGDGYKWSEIAQVNNLANPNVIHPGNELSLPR